MHRENQIRKWLFFFFSGVVSAIFIGGISQKYKHYDDTCQIRQMLMHEKHDLYGACAYIRYRDLKAYIQPEVTDVRHILDKPNK